jgi:O-antigen ligase/polysaccharide polymerase Wzy-like membrane protein
MQVLALLPGLLAAIVAFMRSPERAFLAVYLPTLFFLPDYFRIILPGLPDPTFSQAAVIPVFAAFALRYGRKWQFSMTDLLMVGLAAAVSFSEYRVGGYSDAQNLIFNMLAGAVLPYALAKGMIEPRGLRVEFAKRLVFILFVVSVIALFEFRFIVNPYQLLLGKFFPGQGAGWVTTIRWGFGRVAGPFAHAILAGVILVSGLRLQRWLARSGYWEPSFRWLPTFGLSKSRLITLGLLAGVLMTLSRGPWIGGIAATAICAIGRSPNRKQAVTLVGAAFFLLGIPAAIGIWNYASVGRAGALSDTQETAAYRKELIDKYVDIGMKESVWGWGLNDWPKLPGMPSIDNYYLLLFLMHGLVSLGLFVAIIVLTSIRLFRAGMNLPHDEPGGAPLAFTLLGLQMVLAFSVLTVYMGKQVVPLFALVTGWADGYLLGLSTRALSCETATADAITDSRFRRVIA